MMKGIFGMRRRITAIATLMLSIGFTAILFLVTAQAAEGWNMSGGEWSYYDQNNRTVTLTWKKSKDYWYYLSEDGTILKHCVFRDKDSVYYVDEEGRMVQDTWIYADAGKTAKDGFEEGWYYFGADGKVTGVRTAALKEI